MKHFFHTFTPSLKQMAFMLLSLGLVLFVMMAFFGSCSPNNQGTAGSTVNNNPDSGADDDDATDSRRRSSDDDEPEGCDDDEGDRCKGNEACEQICESIYDKWGAIRSCMDRGDETVAKLQTIHDILMGDKAGKTGADDRSASTVERDLAKIKDDDDDEDVDHDDLKCYLQIGYQKYISQLEKGLKPTISNDNVAKRANLIATLKWLVEDDQEAAEVMVDVNAGDNILEALLLKLAEGPGGTVPNGTADCITGTDYAEAVATVALPDSGGNGNIQKDIWWVTNNDINIRYFEGSAGKTGTIALDSTEDKTLYNALSCFHDGDISDQNIFLYAIEEKNQHMLDLAFDLLMNICNKVEDSSNKKAGCARALMCWSAWQSECNVRGKYSSGTCTSGEPEGNTQFWKELSDHESQLEKSSGSNYDECEARRFADFF